VVVAAAGTAAAAVEVAAVEAAAVEAAATGAGAVGATGAAVGGGLAAAAAATFLLPFFFAATVMLAAAGLLAAAALGERFFDRLDMAAEGSAATESRQTPQIVETSTISAHREPSCGKLESAGEVEMDARGQQGEQSEQSEHRAGGGGRARGLSARARVLCASPLPLSSRPC